MAEVPIHNHIRRLQAERPVDNPGAYTFLESKYRGQLDTRRINAILASVKRPEGVSQEMVDNTRIVIAIPAAQNEMGLGRALNSYTRLAEYSKQLMGQDCIKFEVAVLVNGNPVNGDSNASMNSQAYKDAEKFMQAHPKFPLTLAAITYPKGHVFTIGEARRDLATLTLARAMETTAPVDIDNLILVSNDADTQKVSPNYIKEIVERFDKNPKLAALAGFYDYSSEDFDTDHVFFAFQRISDAYEIINRHRKNNTIMRGGNSAFRMKPYLRKKGNPNEVVSEHRPLLNGFRHEDPQSVDYAPHNSDMSITTSARRQLFARRRGEPLSFSHAKFSRPGDIAEEYLQDRKDFKIPEETTKFTNSEFQTDLQGELDAMYRKLVEMNPTHEDEIKKNLSLAATIMGVRIHFARMTKER